MDEKIMNQYYRRTLDELFPPEHRAKMQEIYERMAKEAEEYMENNKDMTMSKIYLGIDPGENGGLAWLDYDGSLLECQKMPATPEDVLTALGNYDCKNVVCFMEKVGGIPGQGAAASFSFGKGYGELTMALLARGISTTIVTPQRWQKHFNLSGKKGESKTSHKNRIKAWSQQRFPKQKVTLWAADALAIASYGFEMRK